MAKDKKAPDGSDVVDQTKALSAAAQYLQEISKTSTSVEDLQKKLDTFIEKFPAAAGMLENTFGKRSRRLSEDIDDMNKFNGLLKKQMDARNDILSVEKLNLMASKSHLDNLTKEAQKRSEYEHTEDKINAIEKELLKRHQEGDPLTDNASNALKEFLALLKQKKEMMDHEKMAQEMGKTVLEKSKDLLGDQGKKVFDLAKGWADVAKTGNPYLVALKVMSDLIMLSIDRFIELQKAGEDFRRMTGLNVDQTKQLDEVALKLNQDYQQFGVSIKDAYDAAGDLMGELGNVNVLNNNKKLVETTVLLSKNLGVTSSHGAKFLTQTMSLSGVSSNVAASYASYAGNLAKAAGVPLDRMMKDVAEAGDETLMMVRGSTLELIKASASALRLGTNLNTVAKSAQSMLKFQSSVTDEMEASVLVGKQLNFMESRRLSYAGKSAEAAQATLNTIKSAGDFQKMNVFQQEAVAKAAGMGVGEINKMLMMEKQLGQLSVEQREEYERLTKLSKEKVEQTGQDLLKQAKMQSALTNINNSFQKIINAMSDTLLPVVEKVAGALEIIIKFVTDNFKILKWVAIIWGTIKLLTWLSAQDVKKYNFELLKSKGLSGDILKNLSWKNTGELFKKLLLGGRNLITIIRTAFTALTSGLLGSVLAVIAAAFAGWKLGEFLREQFPAIDEFTEYIFEFWMDQWYALKKKTAEIWDGMMNGIKDGWESTKTLLKKWLIEPFSNLWNYCKKTIMGESPSELGLGIVEGIKSVGGMLFDALTSPFTMLWDFVKELFPNVADFLVSAFKKGLDFIMKIPGVSWALEKVGVKMPVTNAVGSTTSEKENKVENVDDTNAQILSKLDELINLMKSGGIAVNIDGRRASELLAQASSY